MPSDIVARHQPAHRPPPVLGPTKKSE